MYFIVKISILFFFQVLLLCFFFLQESIAQNFNIETVYVKEEIGATEAQVKFALQAVMVHWSWFPFFIILQFISPMNL